MNYGIRVKNPLSKHVRVKVVDGKTIIRETVIDPGSTKFISLDRPGEYDLRTTILDRVSGAIDEELGPASWNSIDHEDVAQSKTRPVSIDNTVVLEVPKEQKSAKYWRDVVMWKVAPGSFGELLAVEIEQNDNVSWRLKIMKPGNGRFGGKIVNLPRTTTFSNNMVTGGEIIKLQAKSTAAFGITVSGRISGRETWVSKGLSPAEVKAEPVEEEEEVEVRSLADMFKDMEKEEVKV